ncbi:hypothetical protein Hanom_Chr17g01567771 [Helianthus anomalus]
MVFLALMSFKSKFKNCPSSADVVIRFLYFHITNNKPSSKSRKSFFQKRNVFFKVKL